MIPLAFTLSGLSLLMSTFFLVKTKAYRMYMMFFPLIAGALSPFWAVLGVFGAVLGWLYGAIWAIPIGLAGAITMVAYIRGCTRDHKGFEEAFGSDWAVNVPPEQVSKLPDKRWSWFLSMKASPESTWERDVSFWTIPDTDRELLCDIWHPDDNINSGLAYIFLHGSAWAVADKDFGTRPLFRHLTAQGHTIMDISYRLIPEVDIYGMVGDAKRAVAWLKANAGRFGVDPEKIVLGGGSAGAHIALLAGYAPVHPDLTPDDLKEQDLSVCGLCTYYAPTDLVAGFDVYDINTLAAKNPDLPVGIRVDPKSSFNYAGRLDILLGGNPDDVPDMYKLANPINHITADTPPTLLIQGDRDTLVPYKDTQVFHKKLVDSGVPAVSVVFPRTEHAFDLLFPQVSPPAQSALYDIDRFLAMLATKP